MIRKWNTKNKNRKRG